VGAIIASSLAMSAITVTSASYAEPNSSHAPKWLISKREDVIWFIGRTHTGYLSLLLVMGAKQSFATTSLLFVWGALVGGPHFFATATRTYLDSEQRRKLAQILWLILPLSILAAILGLVSKSLLFVIGAFWGTFHIAKQHVGIVTLYRRLNNERDKRDLLVDILLCG